VTNNLVLNVHPDQEYGEFFENNDEDEEYVDEDAEADREDDEEAAGPVPDNQLKREEVCKTLLRITGYKQGDSIDDI
jgi:hypothetical protein